MYPRKIQKTGNGAMNMISCSKNCLQCKRCFRGELAVLDKLGSVPIPSTPRDGYGIAIDLGTTTVVLALVSLESGQILARSGFANPQLIFGADVISRIQNASSGKLEAMHNTITVALSSSIFELLQKEGAEWCKVKDIVIAGNTTMIYILLNLPCDSLCAFPFVPRYSLEPSYHAHELFEIPSLDCKVRIVPFISAFVGGDITAGITQLKTTGISLLVDLGTNGEMAISYPGGLIVTSTAAGPAFEGGHISCGTPSVTGAICAVDSTKEGFRYATIDNAPPVGICGSALLDIAAILVRDNFMNQTGCLDEEFFHTGVTIARTKTGSSIVITQQDIRELQLAKSAIRSGIEILLLETGLSAKQVDYVYLAGGLGQALRTESAITIGLLPNELRLKVTGLGNSSLAGAVSLLLNPQVQVKQTINNAREINLAVHPKFNELFIDYMEF